MEVIYLKQLQKILYYSWKFIFYVLEQYIMKLSLLITKNYFVILRRCRIFKRFWKYLNALLGLVSVWRNVWYYIKKLFWRVKFNVVFKKNQNWIAKIITNLILHWLTNRFHFNIFIMNCCLIKKIHNKQYLH